MPYIVVLGTIFFVTASWFLWLYLDTRRKKRDRIQLRLLVGRSRLLQEEIDRSMDALDGLDLEALATARQQANSAIDALHIFLVERQAYLQDREELGHLQRTKIALQENKIRALAKGAVAEKSQRQASEAPTPAPPRNRSTIENQLLNKIGSVQPKDRKPPPK